MDSQILLIASILVNGAIVIWILDFLLRPTSIPGFGYPHWLPAGSYIGGVRFFSGSFDMISDACKKCRLRVFRVPRWNDWLYVVSGEELVNEFHALPDEILSINDSAAQEFQTNYTMGAGFNQNPYHVPILRVKLNRHLDYLVEEILDELIPAFEDVLVQNVHNGVAELHGLDTMLKLVSRAMNRILIGAPMCRDDQYRNIAHCFTINTFFAGSVINLFPWFLQPIVGKAARHFFKKTLKDGLECIGKFVADQQAMRAEHGVCDAENTILAWLIEAAEGPEKSTESLVSRILALNIITIPTSSMTLTQTLINVALHPEWATRLRSEATSALMERGWTRQMLNNLPEADAFIKESMRKNTLGSRFPRKAMKQFQFSDGTTIPKGASVSAAMAVHFDERYYASPHKFDPSRFLSGPTGGRSSMVNTSAHFLTFGDGAHKCVSFCSSPQSGRFIASYIMKAILAHMVLNYDITIIGSDGNVRPRDLWFGYVCIPNSKFKFKFNKVQ